MPDGHEEWLCSFSFFVEFVVDDDEETRDVFFLWCVEEVDGVDELYMCVWLSAEHPAFLEEVALGFEFGVLLVDVGALVHLVEVGVCGGVVDGQRTTDGGVVFSNGCCGCYGWGVVV